MPNSNEIHFGEFTYKDHVRTEWLDDNGHMNLGYYLILFDASTEVLFTEAGIGSGTPTPDRHSVFTLEAHMSYHNELLLGEAFYCRTRLLGYDHNKLRYAHWMFKEQGDELCATNELLSLNVDLATRRACPFNLAARKNLAKISKRHRGLGPLPDSLGATIRDIGFPAD